MDDDLTVLVDCETGRRMGCHALCCRLFVGLTLEELDRGLEVQSPLSCVLCQEPDGFCTYLDRESHRCTIWERRPLACRLYDCNRDPMLQAVLREGFTSFTRAMATAKTVPRSEWIAIPLLEDT